MRFGPTLTPTSGRNAIGELIFLPIKAVNAFEIPPVTQTTLPSPTDVRLGGCFALTLLGLRREEVGGLRWSDIDLDTGALHIRRARVDVNGRATIVPTKTERSARGLPGTPPRELAMLKAMRSVHLRERLAVGRPLTYADLLLSRVDGTVATGARLLERVCTPAHLRHSNISWMRAAGIAADVVAAWHGHTERITQAVYGRVTDDRLTAAADVFSSAVGQS